MVVNVHTEGNSSFGRAILVVEDDQQLREALDELLTEAGYQVTSVSTGEAALRYLCASNPPPALVLTDLLLPGLNAWELAAEMRRRQKLSHVPLVAMTGASIARNSESQLGQPIIAKPFNPEELLAIIRGRIASP
jgi:two-component system, OmpR family, response regulator